MGPIARVFAVVGFIILAICPSYSQEVVFVPKGAQSAFHLGQAMGKGLAGAIDAAEKSAIAKQNLSQSIAEARARFWANYPDGRDNEEANSAFAKLLFGKDLAYLIYYLPEGPYSPRARLIKNLTGGDIDGGIDPVVEEKYFFWVEGIREALGARNHWGKKTDLLVASADDLLKAFSRSTVQARYDEYKLARDRREFIKMDRGEDFDDLLAASRPAPSTNLIRSGCMDYRFHTTVPEAQECYYNYGELPTGYVPSVEPDAVDGNVLTINYNIDAKRDGALKTMTLLQRMGGHELGPKYFDGNNDYLREISADVDQLTRSGVHIVGCAYVDSSASQGARYLTFWYPKAPTSDFLQKMRNKDPDHPILWGYRNAVLSAVEKCPATLIEARN